ncbi:putative acyltransferase [Duganella sp. SG902]|uniref:acyltransferase family protein n=1 Tax=Duganella sp. SG902 TaxID=2587016 RepID=UPI00159D0854|nr:heparan-alpha-glucosaminide N-acetyltransferase domain-containing protein [Duganella sp. SG902]NVM76579.1 putative acyltransferase [Duganella sp. SG902]
MTGRRRYLSLDVLRGLTVALMIVVNTPGDGSQAYAPLLHAAWHGFTLTDWVFPTFLFAVGNALAFVLPGYAAQGRAVVLSRIAKRSALIFLLGFLLYWFPFFTSDSAGGWMLSPLDHTRIPGVLQRIGLCFGLASLVLYFWGQRGGWWFCLAALPAYWVLMAAFGDYTLAGNAGRQLDLWLLGKHHLYHGEGIAFDPEGVLGTLPATVNVIAGYFAGHLLITRGHGRDTLARLALAGGACVVLALCWNSVFPINKKLWTSSYVLLTVGLDLWLLPLLVWLIEVRGARRGTYFFEVLGKNTLFIYLLSEVAVVVLQRLTIGGRDGYSWLYATLFQGWAPPQASSLLFAVAFMLMCWTVGWIMDRRGIYVKV